MADFYENAAGRQFQHLQAQITRSHAELQQYQAEGDQDSAAAELQHLAGLKRQVKELTELAVEHANAQNAAKEREDNFMDSKLHPSNAGEALRIINHHKRPGDPGYVTPQEYANNQAKLALAKSKGEYGGRGG